MGKKCKKYTSKWSFWRKISKKVCLKVIQGKKELHIDISFAYFIGLKIILNFQYDLKPKISFLEIIFRFYGSFWGNVEENWSNLSLELRKKLKKSIIEKWLHSTQTNPTWNLTTSIFLSHQITYEVFHQSGLNESLWTNF